MSHSQIIKSLLSATFCLTTFFSGNVLAQTVSLKGKLTKANGYTLVLLNTDGSSSTVKLNNKGNFTFSKLKLKNLKGSTLQLVGPDGRFYGPVVLGKKGTKVSVSLSGKRKGKKNVIDLGSVSLKTGYAIAPVKFDSTAYAKPSVRSDSKGKPTGAGNSGITTSLLRSRLVNYAGAPANPGQDSDLDGIVNSIDADDNGNGVLDSADPAATGTDTPYVGLNFDFRKTLNAYVRTGLSDSVINDVVAGENVFNSTFFISLPQNTTVDGGYIVCGDALTYCRRNNPLGFSGGVSESSDAFRGLMSTLLNSQGYPQLERINMNGNIAVVLSMQPRVGRDVFRPGDLYRVVLTSGGRDVSSRTFTLPPYFVSVPALKEYTANNVTTQVDYNAVTPTSGGIDGVSPGQPIVLGSDGVLGLSFWRPQREAAREGETGYLDFGGLNYGVIIENAQATCSGFYSLVSSDLNEDTNALGNGGSPLANQGANMNPLVDTQTDRPVSSSNLLSFSVDLKSCLARSGGTPGTYSVTLSAAGADVTGGRNTTNQIFYVSIP
jgi:hypothetical protein